MMARSSGLGVAWMSGRRDGKKGGKEREREREIKIKQAVAAIPVIPGSPAIQTSISSKK